jgi:hypothetical protein
VNVYPFIEAERQRSHDEAGGGNVARACELLKVSRSAYYAHAATEAAGGTARAREDAELTARIVALHEDSKGTYGAPRIHADLAEAGHRHGRKRVARLMRKAGVKGRTPKRFRKTTIPDTAAGVREDLIGRDFTTNPFALDERWCGDITSWESQRVVTRSAA